MEGFLNIRLRPWLRRLITRGIAILPAVIVTAMWGERGTANLLVLSQVILSLQLSFAVVPLVMFTSDKKLMGEFTNATWLKVAAWTVAIPAHAEHIYVKAGSLDNPSAVRPAHQSWLDSAVPWREIDPTIPRHRRSRTG